jgi:hypothetical protein
MRVVNTSLGLEIYLSAKIDLGVWVIWEHKRIRLDSCVSDMMIMHLESTLNF